MKLLHVLAYAALSALVYLFLYMKKDSNNEHTMIFCLMVLTIHTLFLKMVVESFSTLFPLIPRQVNAYPSPTVKCY